MPDDKVEIISSPLARKNNLTIVGNWFFAESMASRNYGYHQTMFNWQAPEVFRKIQAFDKMFEDEKQEDSNGNKGNVFSRSRAIEKLDERIKELEENLKKEKSGENK